VSEWGRWEKIQRSGTNLEETLATEEFEESFFDEFCFSYWRKGVFVSAPSAANNWADVSQSVRIGQVAYRSSIVSVLLMSRNLARYGTSSPSYLRVVVTGWLVEGSIGIQLSNLCVWVRTGSRWIWERTLHTGEFTLFRLFSSLPYPSLPTHHFSHSLTNWESGVDWLCFISLNHNFGRTRVAQLVSLQHLALHGPVYFKNLLISIRAWLGTVSLTKSVSFVSFKLSWFRTKRRFCRKKRFELIIRTVI